MVVCKQSMRPGRDGAGAVGAAREAQSGDKKREESNNEKEEEEEEEEEEVVIEPRYSKLKSRKSLKFLIFFLNFVSTRVTGYRFLSDFEGDEQLAK